MVGDASPFLGQDGVEMVEIEDADLREREVIELN